MDALLEVADIVKIDVLATESSEVQGLVEICQSLGITTLAEKIEDEAMYE